MHALLLAVAINPSPLEWEIEAAVLEQQRVAARDYWIALGILEEGESAYFTSPYMIENDTADMQERMRRIDPLTPVPEDAHRFPPVDACRECSMLPYHYLRWLEQIEPFLWTDAERQALEAIRWDAQRRMHIWDAAYYARLSWVGPDGRRLKLAALRDLIGQDAFDAGRLPDPLPEAAYTDLRWHHR